MFDNGLSRNFETVGVPFSRGVEYEIDESAMTVRQVWQYGEERGPDYHSPIISDVDLLPSTGNRLIMIHFNNLTSSGSLSWGDFDLVYRSERLSPYAR